MTKDYSPFTPGVPVPVDFFVGRAQEVERLLATTRKSVELGTVQRVFVMGERGIGKSSLCTFAIRVADSQLGVIGLHVFLGGVTTLEEMTRRIFERMLRDSRERPWHESIRRFLGDHVKQVGLFGVTVEFDASQRDLEIAARDFVPALTSLLAQIGDQRKGLLLVLDDINGLAVSREFADWLKSVVDEMATSREALPVTLVLVGLPERRQQIVHGQPSLDRVFDLISIERFAEHEAREFYTRTFARVGSQVTDEALNLLIQYSGGYPAFMHELGDAVFNMDDDGTIDRQDAFAGLVRGAEVIGAKYIEQKIAAAIRSERYKAILTHISREPFGHRFSRKEVVGELPPAEAKVFDNFLRRMRDLGVIRQDLERGPGSYEFTSQLYYLYFWLQTPLEDMSRS